MERGRRNLLLEDDVDERGDGLGVVRHEVEEALHQRVAIIHVITTCEGITRIRLEECPAVVQVAEEVHARLREGGHVNGLKTLQVHHRVLALLVQTLLHGVEERRHLVLRLVLHQLHDTLHLDHVVPAGHSHTHHTHVGRDLRREERVRRLVAVANACDHLLENGGLLFITRHRCSDGELLEGLEGGVVQHEIHTARGALCDSVAVQEDVVELGVSGGRERDLGEGGGERVQ